MLYTDKISFILSDDVVLRIFYNRTCHGQNNQPIWTFWQDNQNIKDLTY